MESDQEVRGALFSVEGRVEHYDRYKAYCKKHGHTADPEPDGYWESKIKPHHKIAGQAIGVTGLMFYFIIKLIGGALGARRD
jgi:hypothetical protein